MPVRRHPVAASLERQALAGVRLDRGLIERLGATYALVRQDDRRLAELFYAKLFAAAPELRPLFRAEPAAQAGKLMAALDAIVRNLADPPANAAMLGELGRRHAGYGAEPAHYELVIELLIGAMGEILGSRADPRALEEWRTALRLVSDQMIAGASDGAGGSRPGG